MSFARFERELIISTVIGITQLWCKLIGMGRNELIFPWGDASQPEVPAPAPLPPTSGFAEIIPSNTEEKGLKNNMEYENNGSQQTPNETSTYTVPPIPEFSFSDVPDSGVVAVDATSADTLVGADILGVPTTAVEPETVISEIRETAHKGVKRFHADTPFVLGVLLFLITAMAGASFYLSFSGLYAAAAWAVGSNPALQFAVPIMLDISIIAFTLSLFVERERGDKVRWTWMAIGAFAAVSATANILHTLVVSTASDSAQLLIGAIISGGAPILLAFATDKIAVKVFRSAEKK